MKLCKPCTQSCMDENGELIEEKEREFLIAHASPEELERMDEIFQQLKYIRDRFAEMEDSTFKNMSDVINQTRTGMREKSLVYCMTERHDNHTLWEAKKDTIAIDGVYIFLEVKDINDVEKKRRIVTRFLDQECKTIFTEVMEDLYPLVKKYGIEKPTLRIRDMETRWGSCLAKKRIITLNKRLLESPRNCIEYVVMHELCHLIHPNHSKQFYSFLTMLMPDWKERKIYLDKNAACWL